MNLKCKKSNFRWEATYCNIKHKETGCPSCSSSGFNPDKPAYLYLLKSQLKDKDIFKVGITNKKPEIRVKTLNGKIKVDILKEVKYDKGREAREKEKKIHTKYHKYSVDREQLRELFGNGFSEWFYQADIE